MPARTLEDTILDLVHGLAADLVPLVRQAALDAAREALLRERHPGKATRVVEIMPAAPPVTATTPSKLKPIAAKTAPPSMPKGLHSAGTERLDDAILHHLAANPGLRAEEITKRLVADPWEVKRALAGLRADGLVQTTGQKRGMRYSVAASGGPAAELSLRAEPEQDDAFAAEVMAPVAE